MAAKNMAHRRKLRAAEAKRDRLMEQMVRTRILLAQTRAEIKALRIQR